MTPTYNRAYALPRLYDSLCQQTRRDFEWLVIDDGSTDGTAELIFDNRIKSDFSINYFYKENGGKHRAINEGVVHATGDWIVIVDSDDLLTGDAVAKLYDVMNHIGSEFVGMCFRKATLSGHIIGISDTALSKSMVMQPIMAGHILKGDLAYVFRTNVMRKCPFPEFPNEKFVPELYIWNKIADIGKIIFYVDQVIYLCEYLPDGYTSNFKINLKRNPCGFGLFYRDQVIRDTRLFGKVKACIRSLQCILYCWLKK
ncbi:glycosyltransferase family 2 protein [Aeromonas hydrophila]|uniref:glycosyltransferase family 2 protein n=1 Tax=Aeromonas hydrophila TaxID=644 RepID=UPI0022AEF7CE|nr:glycosyltransferase family A protein [Aeromonas hydrophila]MCZ4332377.1 glycosyltransferase family A protein [Aeromonas hydrophila]